MYGCSLGLNRNQAPRRATSPTTPRTTANPMPALSIPEYGPSVLVGLVSKVIDVDKVELEGYRCTRRVREYISINMHSPGSVR